MNEFKSRMLKGMKKLNKTEPLYARLDAIQQQIQDARLALDRVLNCSEFNIMNPEDEPNMFADGAKSPTHGRNSIVDEMATFQTQNREDQLRANQEFDDAGQQLADLKLQNGNQFEHVLERLFSLQATYNRSLDDSLKLNRRNESLLEAMGQRLDAAQQHNDKRLQELHLLLQQITSKLNV
jgi:hypothetical protein